MELALNLGCQLDTLLTTRACPEKLHKNTIFILFMLAHAGRKKCSRHDVSHCEMKQSSDRQFHALHIIKLSGT